MTHSSFHELNLKLNPKLSPKTLANLLVSGMISIVNLSCGQPSTNSSQKISLRQLHVQESSAVNSPDTVDDSGDQVPSNDSSGNAVNNSSSPNNPSSPGSSTSSQGSTSSDPGGTSPDPNKKVTDSVVAFGKTVFPLGEKWCGGACHVTAQAPVFANSDLTLAHDSLLTTNKVDFKDIAKSRMVLRLSQDNHNCPAEGCAAAAAEMIAAIQEWAKEVGDSATTKTDGPKIPTTAALLMSAAESTRMDSGLPPGTLFFEAEAGTLKAPMVALPVTNASGGMVVHTPAGAGSQTNITTAETATNLGSVTFDLDVTEAGSYRVIGKINAPANANSSFYLKVDAAPLLLWDFPTSGANYVFDVADAAAATGTPHLLNLTAGKHKLEVRQREEQTKLDTIILTIDTGLDPMSVKPVPRQVKTLGFDLGELTGIAGAKFTIDMIDYSDNAYMFKNPKMVVPAGSLKVKGIKLYVNGKYLPQNATYTVVDTVVKSPGTLLSSSALIAVKDKGVNMDQFSFSFDVLEKSP